MKRTIFVLSTMLVVFVAVFAALVLRPIPKVGAVSCSKSSLKSNYGLVAPGNHGSTGWNLFMLAKFDGSGTFTGSHVYAVQGGDVVPGSDGSFSGGAYSVDSDCKFTADTNALEVFGYSEMHLEGIVVRGGNEVLGTWYSRDDRSGTFDAKNVIPY